MGEIVNLRRVRKAKDRAEAAAQADTNRVKHGVAKKVHDIARARIEKDDQAAEMHKLDDNE
jgi:hypothetical protein